MVIKKLKRLLKYIYWEIYGSWISNPEIPSNPASFLFVCKGNICRSPFAEGIANKYYGKTNHIKCSSAGIYVPHPTHSPFEAIRAAKAFGVDLEKHKSNPIDSIMLNSFDMILTMETWQHVYLNKKFPEFRNKLFLLPMFEREPQSTKGKYYSLNIMDPYGKPLENFISCFKRIDNCINELYFKIKINLD